MLSVLKELIRYYPKDNYLYTLAAVYSELGDTKKQMALTEVLFEKGYLSGEKHAVNLANLYLLHGIPYKAAVLLQKEIDAKHVKSTQRNLRLLAHAWQQARDDEKAIPPMRLAAENSKDGVLYIRLAQSYINLERWAEAVKAIRLGLAKGNVHNLNTAHIMLGTALFNMNKLDDAQKVFSKVAKSDIKKDRKMANTWLVFLDSEMRRVELGQQTSPDFQRNSEAQENIKQLL
jgi:tetratricopeptide (TPR) repeat protein